MIGNLVIFGDSYSSYKGYVPEGCLYCYSLEEEKENYRMDVSDMWWYKLRERTDANIILTATASGSAIGYTGWNGYLPEYSFIGRFEKFENEGFFRENKVDTLMIFGGTNDYWIPSPLGVYKTEGITDEDKKCVLPATSYLFSHVRETLPDTRIIVLINDEIRGPIRETFLKECERLGFEKVEFKSIEKIDGHPTANGMTEIANQIIDSLEEK